MLRWRLVNDIAARVYQAFTGATTPKAGVGLQRRVCGFEALRFQPRGVARALFPALCALFQRRRLARAYRAPKKTKRVHPPVFAAR